MANFSLGEEFWPLYASLGALSAHVSWRPGQRPPTPRLVCTLLPGGSPSRPSTACGAPLRCPPLRASLDVAPRPGSNGLDEPSGPSLSRMKRKSRRIQTEAAFVPPGHGSGGRLVLDLHTRPLARSLRPLPDRRTPSRSLLASLPVTGCAVRVRGPRTERSWSRRLGGRTGHAADCACACWATRKRSRW